MINGVHVKVCGLTRASDAKAAADVGADYLAFNFYSASPRYLTLEAYKDLAPELPEGPRRVAVMVEPTTEELAAVIAAGFDLFQIHFAHTIPFEVIQGWSLQVGAHRLWLAPKLPPGADVPIEWLPLAASFLLDTFHAKGFGGSGKTGDWGKFASHQERHPQNTWILAGGLNPENIVEAIARSGARFVDVNSGVESAPGVKDAGKLALLSAMLGGRSD